MTYVSLYKFKKLFEYKQSDTLHKKELKEMWQTLVAAYEERFSTKVRHYITYDGNCMENSGKCKDELYQLHKVKENFFTLTKDTHSCTLYAEKYSNKLILEIKYHKPGERQLHTKITPLFFLTEKKSKQYVKWLDEPHRLIRYVRPFAFPVALLTHFRANGELAHQIA